MRGFTQRHASQIAGKLGMKINPGRGHDIATFSYGGKVILTFGIRRASKQVSHDYVPKQLSMSPRRCWEFHDCTLTKEGLIETLRQKGLLFTD